MEPIKKFSFRQRAHRMRERRWRKTDFDGRDAEAARLEDDADAAGRDALPQAANHAAGYQDVLHLPPPRSPLHFAPLSSPFGGPTPIPPAPPSPACSRALEGGATASERAMERTEWKPKMKEFMLRCSAGKPSGLSGTHHREP